MERLRYVARAGGGDPAVVVGDTVEAIRGLRPGPGELVTVCRNLVDRNMTCGPLWWLCARLLSEPDALAAAWDLADEIVEDPTAVHLAEAIPDNAVVLTIGFPMVAARALARRGDLTTLAVDASHATNALIRLLDRNDVDSVLVPPEAMLVAAERADLVVIEVEAVTASTAVAQMGSSLLVVAAEARSTPVWLVAGRGRRLPAAYVDAIARRVECAEQPWEAEFELVPTDGVTSVVGPGGVVTASRHALASECAAVPELVPPLIPSA